MSAERLIVESTLSALWRVSYDAMNDWRQARLIASDEQEALAPGMPSHMYRLSTIDRMHRQWCRNFGELPLPHTTKMLAAPAGTHALLTSAETALFLRIHVDTLYDEVRRGALPVIVLPGGDHLFRFPATVIRDIKQTANSTAVDLATTCAMLNLHEPKVRLLVASGALKRTHVPGRGDRCFVTRESLMQTLFGLLENITPEEWWQRRMGAKLLTRKAIARDYHISPQKLNEWMAEDAVPTLYSPSRRFARMPDWAVDELLANRQPLATGQLQRIFPAPTEIIEAWERHYRLCAHTHKHSHHTCTSKVCVRAYVTANRTTPDFSADDWLERCLHDGALPISADELVATTVGTDMGDIERALADGSLRGVYLPETNGERRTVIMRSDAVAWRRAQERRLRNKYE